MNLSDFIEANLPGLIDDWTEYARKLDGGRSRLSDQQLRNSARDLLRRIAADMREGRRLHNSTPNRGATAHLRNRASMKPPTSTPTTASRTGSTSTIWWRNTARCAPACCAGGSKIRRLTPWRCRR